MRAVDGLRELTEALGGYGIPDPHREAEIILAHCLQIERTILYRDNPTLLPVQQGEIGSILARRARREPLQYIIGHVEFCGLRIGIGPGVLIPRPETETMAAEIIKTVKGEASYVPRKILDLCTGSGCLALALAHQFPEARVFGVDVSEKALEYAVHNAGVNGIGNVMFLQGDLFDPVSGTQFDIIVSNPPYIKEEDMGDLQPEIRSWEPREALTGGGDGLRFYREIVSRAPGYLEQGGSLYLELGQGAAQDVIAMASGTGLRCAALLKDYAGIDRVLRLSLS